MHTIATNARAFISHQGSCILQHSMLMHSLAFQALAITSNHCSPVIYSSIRLMQLLVSSIIYTLLGAKVYALLSLMGKFLSQQTLAQ